MKTSKSIVLVGVSFRYLCQTWRATSCGDDLADNDEVEAEAVLVCVAEGARDAGWATCALIGGAAALGVAGCAGFLAIFADMEQVGCERDRVLVSSNFRYRRS